MSILDSSDFSSSAGWTGGTTSTETYNQLDGSRIYVSKTAGGNNSTSGLFRTTGISGVSGHVIYVDRRHPQAFNADGVMWGISDAGDTNINIGALNYAHSLGINMRQDGAETQATSNPFSANIWYNDRWKINANGTISYYYHVDDGTLQDQISEGNWTLLFTSTVAQSFNAIASNIFTKLGLYNQDIHFSRFNYTDNGMMGSSSTPGQGIHQYFLQGKNQYFK